LSSEGSLSYHPLFIGLLPGNIGRGENLGTTSSSERISSGIISQPRTTSGSISQPGISYGSCYYDPISRIGYPNTQGSISQASIQIGELILKFESHMG